MEETLSAKDITWAHVSEPSNEELAAVVREAQLTPADAEFIVRDHQRPEITVQPDYVVILLLVPVFDKQLRVTSGAAVYLIVTEKKLYTINYEPVVSLQKIMKDFTDHPDKQEEYFGVSALGLALHVMTQLHMSAFRKVRRLAKHIEIAEDAVFHGNERKMVEEVAILTRDVLDFRKIVRPQLNMFAEVVSEPFPDEIKTQLHRLAGQVHQLWEILQSLHESTKELRNTNDSLLQYKENELLRMLTWYSIIAIPVWIFIGPFDPFQREAQAYEHITFWSILGLLVLFLGWIFIHGKRRRVL